MVKKIEDAVKGYMFITLGAVFDCCCSGLKHAFSPSYQITVAL